MTEQLFKDNRPIMDLTSSSLLSIQQMWLVSTIRRFFASAVISKYANNYFACVIHTSCIVDLVVKYPEFIAKSATPQFFVHYANDPFNTTKYSTAKNAAEKIGAPLIKVFGGSGYYGGSCQAHTQHGSKGIEDKLMAHISKLIKTGQVEEAEIR
jgi:hypothetical protein